MDCDANFLRILTSYFIKSTKVSYFGPLIETNARMWISCWQLHKTELFHIKATDYMEMKWGDTTEFRKIIAAEKY
jgi:hypothetical protein